MEINKESLKTSDYFIMAESFKSSNVLNDFETRFFNSINSDYNFYTFQSYSRHNGVWQKNYSDKINTTFGLSKKQNFIYQKIIIKFESLDLFTKYSAYFKFNKINLTDYDKGYLETFIDEYEETDSFKRWVIEVKTLNK